MNCWQLNMHHSQTAAANMELLLTGKQKYIALVQEPYCPFGRVVGVPKDSRLFTGKVGARVRACIYASKDYDAWLLPQFSDEDMAAVAIKEHENNLTVFASVYMPYEARDPPPQKMRDLVKYCEDNHIHLFISCDANAHSTTWGSTDDIVRGENLLEYIMSTTLVVHNRGNRPTFITANREEVLDLTMSTAGAGYRLTDWEVSNEQTFSDHQLITYVVMHASFKRNSGIRNVRNTDWLVYQTRLRERLDDIADDPPKSVEEVEERVQLIEAAIGHAFRKACKPVKEVPAKTPPYWNPELLELRQEARRAFNKHKRNHSEVNLEALRAASRNLKRAVRKAKRQAWRKFCQEIEGAAPAARLHRILKRQPTQTLGVLRRQDGSFTVTPEETLEVLLQAHFPDLPNAGQEDEGPEMGNFDPMEEDLVNQIVTEDRVLMAINSLGPYKAPGADMIQPVLLQRGADILLPHLTRVYKACLTQGYVAKSWQTMKVVFLPKPGRESYSDAKSFRPISLTSFLLKVLERLVYWYLNDGPLKQRPLSTKQYAYKPGVSTEDALHDLVACVEKSIYNGQYTLAVFLDIENAFSNATFDAMEERLAHHGVNPAIRRWISYMLGNRTAKAKIHGTEHERVIERGCPQGGVLSPLLWNILEDEILVEFQQQRRHLQGFADDNSFLVSGPDPITLGQLAQRAINRLQAWADRRHIKFAPAKSECILFTRRRRRAAPELRMYGQTIPRVRQCKYLGVILDDKLSWRPHIHHAVSKALAALAQCRRSVGASWGITPQTMHWLYTRVVLPALEYGCVVWIPGTNSSHLQDRLRKVQRMACMCITAAYGSTPTKGLEMFLGLPPLHIHLQAVAVKTAHRLRLNGKWRANAAAGNMSHVHVCNKLLEQFETMAMPADHMVTQWNLDRKYRAAITRREDFVAPEWPDPAEGELHGYTDGSKTGHGTGSGFTITLPGERLQISLPLGQFADVFQAEVYAIKNACDEISARDTQQHHVTIFTDSQAALMAVMANKIYSPLVKSCVESLNSLAGRCRSVTLQWVPSHSGYQGNEEADSLAKTAANTRGVGPEPILPVPKALCSREVDLWVTRTHNTEWRREQTCRQSKLMWPRSNRAKAKQLLGLKRPDLRNVIQILSGHANLNRHRCVAKQTLLPFCTKCADEAEETPTHYVGECAAYANERLTHFQTDRLNGEDIANLPVQKLVKFLRVTKRLDEHEQNNEQPNHAQG